MSTPDPPAAATFTYREALRQAMAEEMERDDRVFLMGEEVGQYHGAYKVSEGLLEKFGEKRVIDAPIAESGFAGLCIGAAMAGLRPICEFMTWNFSFVAFDAIVNSAAKIRLMSGGQVTLPIVFRGPAGAAHMLGAQHSHAVDSIYGHFPGILVAIPATPRDAKGLLKSAIRENNPVAFLESELLYGIKGATAPEGELIPLGVAEVKRAGKDCTLVTWGRMLFVALEAAKALEGEGIEVEVIDARTLRPFDEATLLASVRRTNRCVVLHEGFDRASFGAWVADLVAREAFDFLDAPVTRVCSRDVPMPYAPNLERAIMPDAAKVVAAVKQVCYREGG
ncbi:MAG: pyruvate dehydrogenase complex E1 component subunit beta [Myxococcota bacterium]